MTNPLLADHTLPAFDQIDAAHIEPAIDQIIQENTEQLNTLLEQTEYTWENLILPLEIMEDKLGKVWSPASHLHSVMDSDALRQAIEACLPKLTAYETALSQNEDLYRAFQQIRESEAFNHYDNAQQKMINDALRDFKLSGIHLPKEERSALVEILQKLSKLSLAFSNNVLDATDGWYLHVTDESELAGIPEATINNAATLAAEKNIDGWAFSLEFPSYHAVITYAQSSRLRQAIYEAFCTRASDQGPCADKWDNSSNMSELLALRHTLATRLGFDNYAEYSLATKMASSSKEVITFLEDLAKHSMSRGKQDLKAIEDFAKKEEAIDSLNPWDVAYYSEKLCEAEYAISQEALRPYFPINIVLEGMFEIISRLYGVNLKETTEFSSWHPEVRLFDVIDNQGQHLGKLYMDLYARPKKRGGAWMDEYCSRFVLPNGQLQTPVTFIVCNFLGGDGDRPALLTHTDVQTLFHETGHALHHLLGKADFPSASMGSVAWDAIELPSQFFENWCWDKESLALIARHHETNEILPEALFNQLIASKNFCSGMQMLRQIEFSLFDFHIHMDYDPEKGDQIQNTLDSIRDKYAVMKPPAYNRFQHGFSHIFSGGYSAGYYSYKWAEVLSSDAFSLFEQNGIFDAATGKKFLEEILEKGAMEEAMDLFVAFRGRAPSIEPLLRHSGIEVEDAIL